MPLWEACQERGLPVVLKNGDTGDIDRLATRLPDLKIVLSHFGGFRESVNRERIAVIQAHGNVTLDSGGLPHRMRYPFAQAQEVMHEVVEAVGADRIAWGSDYPRPTLTADVSYKQQLEFITLECDFLSPVQREQIVSGTALRIYPWASA
jgi:predicted TIM-barrel fold metal-dependent hydrolase